MSKSDESGYDALDRYNLPDRDVVGYPGPGDNPECRCPNLIAAFFCMTGHMTECHYPMSCAAARCSHLAQYDEPPYDPDAEVKFRRENPREDDDR